MLTATVNKDLKILSESDGIGDSLLDKEGRVVLVEYEKFYLVNVYQPFSGCAYERLRFRLDKWDQCFSAYLRKLEAIKPVIVAGDLNVFLTPLDCWDPLDCFGMASGTVEEINSHYDVFPRDKYVDAYRYLYPMA